MHSSADTILYFMVRNELTLEIDPENLKQCGPQKIQFFTQS